MSRLLTVSTIDQRVAELGYKETKVSWSDLEGSLTIVAPPEDKGSPELYFSLTSKALPLTRAAASQFGRISGIRPSLYREFYRDSALTARMVRCSLNHEARSGGQVIVMHTPDKILGFLSCEKPHVGMKTAFDLLKTVPGGKYADFQITPEGVAEFVVTTGGDQQSVKPGVYMQYVGRPIFGKHLTLHDFSGVVSAPKPPKKTKKGSLENAITKMVETVTNDAIEKSQYVYNLYQTPIPDPARFLTRLCMLEKFSSQAAESVTSGAMAALPAGTNHYDVVRFVAGLAKGEKKKEIDRRYQLLAYQAALRGSGVCAGCGLPH